MPTGNRDQSAAALFKSPALATIDSGRVNLWARNGLWLDSKYPLIVLELEGLKLNSAILYGEIVALDAEGIPRFGLLQRYQRDRSGTLMYLVFDLPTSIKRT